MLMEIIIGVFGFVLTLLGTLVVTYFKSMSKNMETMSQNMIEMNIKLEKVITDQSWHKEEMKGMKEDHDEISNKLNNARERLHALEGHVPIIKDFIEDLIKEK
jgi:hypothetical protein